jgi:hypothetical protein
MRKLYSDKESRREAPNIRVLLYLSFYHATIIIALRCFANLDLCSCGFIVYSFLTTNNNRHKIHTQLLRVEMEVASAQHDQRKK